LPIDRIAERAGFGTATSWQNLRTTVGVSPNGIADFRRIGSAEV